MENLRLFKPFFRGFPIIILSITLGVFLAKKYLRYATPMFESTAKIRLADVKEGTSSANLFKDFDVFANANKIGAEVEVLKSPILINKALDSLDFDISIFRLGQIRKNELYHDSPIVIRNLEVRDESIYDKPMHLSINYDHQIRLEIPTIDTVITSVMDSVIELAQIRLTFCLNEALIAVKPEISIADNYELILHSRQKLIRSVSKNLDITSIEKDIPILRISYTSPVAEKTAIMANRLTETYVNDFIEAKYMAANTTVSFLDQQLREMSGQLSAAERAIESYRDEENIINLRQETETDLRKIAQLKIQQANIKLSLEALDSLDRYIRQGSDKFLELAPNFQAYNDMLSTEMMKNIKLLQNERTELLRRYTPENEKVKVVEEKIKNISTYVVEGIHNSRADMAIKYDQITREIEEAEKVFINLPTKEKKLTILNRDFNLKEQIYNFLHEKRTEAQIARAANISFHRIIAEAEIPNTPVSPNRILIILTSAMLSLLLSTTFIYLVHMLKGKVNDAYTIEKNSLIPVATLTPWLQKNNKIDQHFQKMALDLGIKGLLKPGSIITFSSFNKNEGKTFNAWNMAQTLARRNKKILLINANEKELPIISEADKNIKLISLEKEMELPVDQESLEQKIQNWKTQYDYVVIINENIRQAILGIMLMKISDSNLFVLDSRKTAAKWITEVDALQAEYQLPAVNFILNRFGYNPNIVKQILHTAVKLVSHFLPAKTQRESVFSASKVPV
ncbi:MAG: hypothetical protein KDC80_10900 [Saprospiraceae bacterium]|nr:hypothetical protein [Saprospiraceae bacterium]